MCKVILILLLVLFLTGCAAESPEESMEITLPTKTVMQSEAATEPVKPELLSILVDPREEDFVRIVDYVPDVIVDLKYCTEDNFTGQQIYEFEDVFLRYGTVMKLKTVSEELSAQGLYLKIWDGFRPVSAQFKLWDICPDSTYVANPNKGFSNHSRGFAVDLTLVDESGAELEMPTGFDDFSAKADRDYSDCSKTAAENARLLESVMEKHGFSGYWGEWWHFNDTRKYEVETCFDPGVISRWYTQKETCLLESFWDEGTVVLCIPNGEPLTLLGYDEGYALVEYWGYRGYVSMEDMEK